MLNLLPEQLERLLKGKRIPSAEISNIIKMAKNISQANNSEDQSEIVFLSDVGLKTIIVNSLSRNGINTESDLKKFAKEKGAIAIKTDIRYIGEKFYCDLLEKFPWLEDF